MDIPFLTTQAVLAWLVAACLLVFVYGLSHHLTDGAVLAFLTADILIHLLKRAIFLFGPQRQDVYFSIQILPSVILLLMLATLRRRKSSHLSRPEVFLLCYVVWELTITAISPAKVPVAARFAAVYQDLLPVTLFFVGRRIPVASLARIGVLWAAFLLVSVAYGAWQFVGGPTFLDRAWAFGAGEFSLQAGKTLTAITSPAGVFKIYSFFPDPLIWGYFICVAVVGATATRWLKRMSALHWWIVILAATVGMVLTLSRSPWVLYLSLPPVFWLMRKKTARNRLLIAALLSVAFVAVIFGGQRFLDDYFDPYGGLNSQNTLIDRYATVGTLSARTWALDVFTLIRNQFSIFGAGHGFSMAYVSQFGIEDSDLQKSHNFLVDLFLYGGLPGLLLWVSFFFSWLKDAFVAIDQETRAPLYNIRCLIVAFALGACLEGFFAGLTFTISTFYLVLGMAVSLYSTAPLTNGGRRPFSSRVISLKSVPPDRIPAFSTLSLKQLKGQAPRLP
jgi:hypothetical protein